jgi:hypothetical protein
MHKPAKKQRSSSKLAKGSRMRKGLLIYNPKAGSLDVGLLPRLVSALGEVISVDLEQLGEAPARRRHRSRRSVTLRFDAQRSPSFLPRIAFHSFSIFWISSRSGVLIGDTSATQKSRPIESDNFPAVWSLLKSL